MNSTLIVVTGQSSLIPVGNVVMFMSMSDSLNLYGDANFKTADDTPLWLFSTQFTTAQVGAMQIKNEALYDGFVAQMVGADRVSPNVDLAAAKSAWRVTQWEPDTIDPEVVSIWTVATFEPITAWAENHGLTKINYELEG